MIYAAVINGGAAAFRSLQMLKRVCGEGAAYREIPERDYFLAGRKLYAHNGEILAGATDGEKALIELYKQKERLIQRLEAIDREAGAGRAARGLALAAAEALGIAEGGDYARLQETEARAGALRAELAALTGELEGEAPQ